MIQFFFQIEIPLSAQMKAAFCETEKVLHSAWQQLLEKRSDDEMKSFKICLIGRWPLQERSAVRWSRIS